MTAADTVVVPEHGEIGVDPRAAAGEWSGRVGLIALIALAPASIVYLSFNQGGFFPNATGLTAIAFAAALVLRTTLAEHPFAGYNRQLQILLLSLAAFAAVQLASALWSHDPALSLDAYDRTLLYLLAFALFGSIPRTPARLRWLIRALAVGMTAVCLAGLVSRVLPHLWPTSVSFTASRLAFPLTYGNAEGMMAVIATILLIHIAASGEHPIERVLGAIFVPATAATLLLTYSRGALAVGIVGVIAYLLLARPPAIVGAAVALIPTTAIALRAAYDAVLISSNTPTSPAAVVQGHHLAATIGLCMLAAGALRLAMVLPDRWVARALARVHVPRVPPRAVAAVVVAAVAVAAVALSGVISREWNQFAHANPATQAVRDVNSATAHDRLASVYGDNRVALWRLALHAFRQKPLLGYGAGTYELYYARHRADSSTVTDTHNLYAQVLAELGIVGFIPLAVVVFGILGLLAVRIRGPERTAYAALCTATLVWVIHSGVDWDWQMPAVTLWLFIAAGFALASEPTPVGRSLAAPSNRTLIAVGWLVLAVAPLLIGVSYQRLRVSGREFAAGNCVKAREDAFSSISLLAVRPEPYEIISYCDLQLGYPLEGLQAAEKAVHYAPNGWDYEYGLAIARAENGLDPRSAARRALRLNPREPIVQEEVTAFAKTGPRGWEQKAPQLLIGGLENGRLAISNL